MESSKNFTHDEISLHTSKKDCWLVIHGKVYDVTSFLEDHPGGEDVLLQQVGSGDATEAFEDVGHSTTATSMLDGYFIGYAEGYNGTTSDPKAIGGATSSDKATQDRNQQQQGSFSLFDYIAPLLILLVAVGAWYFLTFHSNAE